jgi:hypothetical protein
LGIPASKDVPENFKQAKDDVSEQEVALNAVPEEQSALLLAL